MDFFYCLSIKYSVDLCLHFTLDDDDTPTQRTTHTPYTHTQTKKQTNKNHSNIIFIQVKREEYSSSRIKGQK